MHQCRYWEHMDLHFVDFASPFPNVLCNFVLAATLSFDVLQCCVWIVSQ